MKKMISYVLYALCTVLFLSGGYMKLSFEKVQPTAVPVETPPAVVVYSTPMPTITADRNLQPVASPIPTP